MECSRSEYSYLAADINLNEVTSRVSGWTQHSHPGTPHQNGFPFFLLGLSISTTHEATEWVTLAIPHATGTNRGITELDIAFWFLG